MHPINGIMFNRHQSHVILKGTFQVAFDAMQLVPMQSKRDPEIATTCINAITTCKNTSMPFVFVSRRRCPEEVTIVSTALLVGALRRTGLSALVCLSSSNQIGHFGLGTSDQFKRTAF